MGRISSKFYIYSMSDIFFLKNFETFFPEKGFRSGNSWLFLPIMTVNVQILYSSFFPSQISQLYPGDLFLVISSPLQQISDNTHVNSFYPLALNHSLGRHETCCCHITWVSICLASNISLHSITSWIRSLFSFHLGAKNLFLT